MASCSKCNGDFSSGGDIVKCCDCGLEFHAACCKIRSASKQSKVSWRCEGCRQDTASGSSQRSDSDGLTVVDMFKNIQKEMAESRTTSTANFARIEKSIDAVNTSLSVITSRLTALEDDNKKLSNKCMELEAKEVKLESRVSVLEQEIIDLQQYSRNKNLEIRGVPMTTNENVYTVLDRLAQSMDVQFSVGVISTAHRLAPPRDSRFSPSIIVQFVSRDVRQQWLIAAKKKRPQTTDLSASLRPGPVFVGEHLTKHNKDLLKMAKSHVKEGRLAYAWTRDGKVYVRKTPQSPPRRVLSAQDINKEAGPPGAGVRVQTASAQ